MPALSLLFLSQDELRELTDLKVPKAQIRWLRAHSFPFEISASGKPKVLRSFLFERLQISMPSNNPSEPNFDAIR